MDQKTLPPSQWLHTFLAVVQAGSFSEAAVSLNMTQAAVSRHVRLLEHQLGAALFARHARGVTPTALAESMRPSVEQAFALLRTASVMHSREQRVRVRADITWAEAVIGPAFGDFCERHPHIQLQLTTFVWPEQGDTDSADVHVLVDVGEWPGFRRQPLGPGVTLAVATPEVVERFRVAAGGVPWLTRIDQEALWDRWSAHHGERPSGAPRLRCNSSVVCKSAALAGQGVAMMRELQVRHALASGELVAVDDFRDHAPTDYALYRRDGEGGGDAEDCVARWLLEVADRGWEGSGEPAPE